MKLNTNKLWRVLLTSALTLTAISNIAAQNERRNIKPDSERMYTISAKAGAVNFVSGDVRFVPNGEQVGKALTKLDSLEDRDTVKTGADGKTEILLNPGSFFRLAENSEVEFTDTAFDSMRLKLAGGSALLEAIAVGGDGADIAVETPQTRIALDRSGIYRINVSKTATEVFVWKGQARVGSEVVKSGRRAFFQNNAATIAKFDKDEKDALDIWSKSRAKELAKLNDKLQRRDLRTAFSGYSAANSQFNDGYGAWVYNRFTGTYCFVPFGWSAWGSPYGYGYNYNIVVGRVPTVVRPTYDISPQKERGLRGSPVFLPPASMPTAPPVTSTPLPRGGGGQMKGD